MHYHLGPTLLRRPFEGAEFAVRIADDEARWRMGLSFNRESHDDVPPPRCAA
jgi:hypothetical protein